MSPLLTEWGGAGGGVRHDRSIPVLFMRRSKHQETLGLHSSLRYSLTGLLTIMRVQKGFVMSLLDIGLNGRFFPNNWRPALQEIAFASANGFRCLQFQGKETGFTEEHLGGPMSEISSALRDANLGSVMEIVVRLTADGRTASRLTPLEVLEANLPAIDAFSCRCVHWHFVAWPLLDRAIVSALEH